MGGAGRWGLRGRASGRERARSRVAAGLGAVSRAPQESGSKAATCGRQSRHAEGEGGERQVGEWG